MCLDAPRILDLINAFVIGRERDFVGGKRRFLRTTSLLERVNRMLRRLFRAAGAFHSAAGLLAAVAKVLNRLCLSGISTDFDTQPYNRPND